MLHRRCLAWTLAGGALAVAYTAAAQDPTPALALGVDPYTLALLEAAKSSPFWGAVSFAAYKLSGWTPTVRVVLVEDSAISELRKRLDEMGQG